MNIESAWMMLVAIATPFAGIVAFYIQLKNVKIANLQNEKLALEIHRLEEENKKLERQIQRPTEEEIKKYGTKDRDVMYSRTRGEDARQSKLGRFLGIDWGSLLIAVLAICFIAYFFYDIYRVGLWLIRQF